MRAGIEPLLPKAELADKISKVAEPLHEYDSRLGGPIFLLLSKA